MRTMRMMMRGRLRRTRRDGEGIRRSVCLGAVRREQTKTVPTVESSPSTSGPAVRPASVPESVVAACAVAATVSLCAALHALRRASDEWRRVAILLRLEIPDTADAVRLSGLEVSDAIEALGDLGGTLGDGARSIGKGAKVVGENVQRAGTGVVPAVKKGARVVNRSVVPVVKKGARTVNEEVMPIVRRRVREATEAVTNGMREGYESDDDDNYEDDGIAYDRNDDMAMRRIRTGGGRVRRVARVVARGASVVRKTAIGIAVVKVASDWAGRISHFRAQQRRRQDLGIDWLDSSGGEGEGGGYGGHGDHEVDLEVDGGSGSDADDGEEHSIRPDEEEQEEFSPTSSTSSMND